LALKLTSEPAPRPTSSAKPRGIRTPRLFPHFWTRVCTATQRLYREYTSPGLQTLRPHLSNAAPEWQARSYCFQSGLDGGLSTPGACSKVSHLHRQRLRSYGSQAELKTPPLHFSHWRSTSGQGPRRP
jgi:hypothetical protein